jgi:protein-S-isoprenylcysteine O-methyltransferase Ste14
MMMGTIYIFCASLLWGLVHSLLATHGFKHIVRKGVGPVAFYRLYRFFYNLFSMASILPVILMLITFPDRALYTIPAPWVYLTTIVQGLAFFALIAGVMQTGVMEFSGLAQLSPYYQDSEPGLLVTDGLYGLVRHPLYSAGLVFMWFSADMTENRLVLWITFTLYILIGAYFEEKKLLKDIGPAYAEYKKNTPMFVPFSNRRT